MKQLISWPVILGGQQDIALVAVFLLAIFMMILPLPTLLVYLLIAANLMFSFILLISALYLSTPLEMATS